VILSDPLAVLAAYGYEPNVEQTDQVKLAIRSIFALAPASTALIAFSFACLFPITQPVHQEIQAGIEAHKRGESVIDPVSGARLAPPRDRGVGEDAGWFLDHFSKGELRRAGRRTRSCATPRSAGVSARAVCRRRGLRVRDSAALSAEPGLMPCWRHHRQAHLQRGDLPPGAAARGGRACAGRSTRDAAQPLGADAAEPPRIRGLVRGVRCFC
jgi:hypothetical protein